MYGDGSAAVFDISYNIDKGNIYFNAYSMNYLGDASETKQASVTQSTPKSNDLNINYSYTAATPIEENYQTLKSKLSSELTVLKDSNYEFSVESNRDGYVSTGFKNIKTLSYKVNGSPVDALVPIKEGTNSITVTYDYTYLLISIIISLFFIISIILYRQFASHKKINKHYSDKLNVITQLCEDNYVYIISILIVIGVFLQ